jgi:tripartite-type tricarboxylate transporter receptor subunit TctC
MKTTLRVAAAALSALLACSASAQAAYPTKPIKMIIPLAAASAVDNAARIVVEKMAANMGQAIVVENVPGAAGTIGADKLAKAAPDGYTIGGFNDSIMTMVPHVQAKVPWDILRDFTPVSLVATVEWGLVVGNDTPFKNAGDLVSAAKAAPGSINYGSGGVGSPQHIAMELFAAAAGIKLSHVPYKGATQAAIGVAGGEVPVAFQGLATVTTLAQGGKLRLVGVTTDAPMPQWPGVPTVDQSGLSGFKFNSWFTMVAPAGTPKDITARLHAEVVKALADPQVRSKLLARGLTPRGTSPAELDAATREQLARYGKVLKAAGVTPK